MVPVNAKVIANTDRIKILIEDTGNNCAQKAIIGESEENTYRSEHYGVEARKDLRMFNNVFTYFYYNLFIIRPGISPTFSC